jgi:hypothetical protein
VAVAAAGVAALARALTPAAAGAGALAASLLAVVPAADLALPTGDAAIAAALATWAMVAVVRARRAARDRAAPSTRRVLAVATASGALIAVDPLAGVVISVVAAAVFGPRLGPRARWGALALALATAAVLVIPLAMRGGDALADAGPAGWRALLAPIAPEPAGLGAALGRLGDGAGSVLLLAGLVGLGLGAATGLPGAAACLGAAVGLAVTAGARPVAAPVPALALLAAGLAPLAAAVSRLGPTTARSTVATLAALPIAVVAVVAPRHLDGPERTDAVVRVAADVLGAAPPGPGVFIAAEPVVHGALRVEHAIAGLRPDLALARPDRLTPRALAAIERARPELHTPGVDDAVAGAEAERLAVGNLRRGLTAAADRASFGRLDPRLAHPAGRGFALALAEDTTTAPPPAPAGYPGPIGARVAGYLAVERARHEALRGRLEAAARAAGLADRFGAADLAVLDIAPLDRDRPALVGYLPEETGRVPPRWLADLFGDDLAWVAGLSPPALDERAPSARRLHARWRAVLDGTLAADDPSIRALGVPAARATARMLGDVGRVADAERAARALLATVDDPATMLILGSALAARGGVGGGGAPDPEQRRVLEEAAAVLARAAAADRRLIDALVVRGLVTHRLGRGDDARASWLAALALAPGRRDVAELLGVAPEPAPAAPASPPP